MVSREEFVKELCRFLLYELDAFSEMWKFLWNKVYVLPSKYVKSLAYIIVKNEFSVEYFYYYEELLTGSIIWRICSFSQSSNV